MGAPKKLLAVLAGLIGIILIGTLGYMLIEGWSLLDALYMTVITITTVGYLEVHEMDSAGRIFTIFLLIGGVGGALYALTTVVEFILEGRLGTTLWRRKMKNRIAHLKEHFILCGYGRVGQEIGRVLADEGADFVVIDRDKDAITHAETDGRLNMLGDASEDEVLNEAGIDRARGLIVALGSDADATYVTLTARQLKPSLFIESRISAPEAEAKLKRAGANRIISPYSLGARRMAMLALQPEVADFIDTVAYRGHELHLENLTINAGSPLAGQKTGEVRKNNKASILTLTKKHGKLIANPSDEELIEAGDRLIALGTREELRALESYCEGCHLDE
jgi:voltage-gated potassium channel